MLTLTALEPYGVIGEFYRNNLLKLAAYLWELPDDYCHFKMQEFFTSPRTETRGESVEPRKIDFGVDGGGEAAWDDPIVTYASLQTCGTAACAVGHGPNAGIPIDPDEISWFVYSYVNFIRDGSQTLPERAWYWCFGGSWQDKDDTPKGAARRIWWLLTHGVSLEDKDLMEAESYLNCMGPSDMPYYGIERKFTNVSGRVCPQYRGTFPFEIGSTIEESSGGWDPISLGC